MDLLLTQLLFITAIVFLFPLLALAQPDSGRIISEQEQEELRDLQTPVQPGEIEVPPEPLADQTVEVRVRGFEFAGYDSIITRDELNNLVSDAVGKKLGFHEMKQLTLKITRYLREEKGYLLAKAYLPQQDVTDGIITIQIMFVRLEGKVGVVVDGPSRINKRFLQKITARAVAGRETLFLNDIERAVLLMNDLPGIAARAYLDKGETPGTSKLTIHVREGPLSAFRVSGDNFGNRYTGRFRRRAEVFLNDLSGRGDLLNVSYTNADELNQGGATYSTPLGASGTVMDFFYSGLRYELGGKLEDLRAEGHAHTLGSNIRYPLKRTRSSSLWLGSGCEYYLLEDKALGAVTSDRNLSVGNINILGHFYDGFLRGGLTSVYLSFLSGNVSITDGQAADDAGARSEGVFFRSEYSLARLQNVMNNVSLFAAVRGHLSDSNLDSSQKFILGGPGGVRAYPVGEASGDIGHLFTLETRFDLPETPSGIRAQFILFGDLGYIRLHKDTWPGAVTNISGRNHYWLFGAGPGLNIEKPGTFRLQMSYGHKLGNNAGRDSSGHDVNNRDDSGTFWIKGTIWF